MGKGRARPPSATEGKEKIPGRTGTYTSGTVSTRAGQKIALFFTGRQHAGENLADVLAHRAQEAEPPIQMCDALSRNVPKAFEVILANCMTHGRRKFVEVMEDFPEACLYVVEALAEVFRNDTYCQEQGMSPEECLQYHQAHSGPRMEILKEWSSRQFTEHLVEPNSGLGQTITYMQRHWEALTLFLRP
jgi:hypothetical protein